MNRKLFGFPPGPWSEYVRISKQLGLIAATTYYGGLIGGRLRGRGTGFRYRVREPLTGHLMTIRQGTSDLDNYLAVEQDYSPLAPILTSAKTILDCGAYLGYASHYFLSRSKDCRVIAVEPVREHFELLGANLRPYASRVSLVHGAIWSEPRAMAVVTGAPGNEWGASVSPASAGAEETVPATTIPRLLDEHGIERADLIKIDIEGAETELFKGESSKAWLDRCDNLVIELHGPEAERELARLLASYEHRLTRSGDVTLAQGLRRR